jgi:hypothetical protein
LRATRQVDNSTAWQSKSVITLTALAWGSFHVSYKLRRAISFIRVGQGWLGTVDYRFHHQAMVTTRSKGKQAITSGHQQAPTFGSHQRPPIRVHIQAPSLPFRLVSRRLHGASATKGSSPATKRLPPRANLQRPSACHQGLIYTCVYRFLP